MRIFLLQHCALFFFLFSINASGQVLDNFKKHTIYLSSDNLEGRGIGSRGIRRAADYIAKEFDAIGLMPINNDSYFQRFTYPDQEQLESNVVGFIPAKQPTNRSILFSAHYDSFGIQKTEDENDSIYNGARDNTIGVAALIELARMYRSEDAPVQNIVFIATAAEELGQYGADFYAENPIFNLEDVTMCLNIDGFNVSGKRINFFVMPRQGIDYLDDMVLLAQRSGWMYDPPDWVDSMNTNFDTSSFLKRGVPAMTIWIGDRLINGEMAPRLNFGDIHSPLDQVNEDWNWSGVMDHLELYKKTCDYFMHCQGKSKVKNPELFE